MTFFIILAIYTQLNLIENMINCNTIIPETIIACQDTFILLGSEKNSAKVIDVVNGVSVKLYCGFCFAETGKTSKMWYRKKRGLNYPMKTLTEKEFYDENMSLASDNVLKINVFNNNISSGIYSCKDSDAEDQPIFTYVLEGVYISKDVVPYTGLLDEWVNYKKKLLDPINTQFENSNLEPFATFKKYYSFSFRVKTYWEPWGKCEIYNTLVGVRKKIGKCRLKVLPNKNNASSKINSAIDDINQFYLAESYDIPCNAIHLNETLPSISKVVRKIPDYEAREPCVTEHRILMLPSLDTEFKFTSSKQIPENGHVILICSEGALNSKVQWFKDNQLLNSSYRYNTANNEKEPHITIDSYNSLFISHATKKEEGNYSCIVDGTKMHRYDIKIFKKSALLNDDFFRYSVYLGFVLLVTTTCYCAGIFVAWHERASFSDPLCLYSKSKQYQHLPTADRVE